jgi:hypothetical protein
MYIKVLIYYYKHSKKYSSRDKIPLRKTVLYLRKKRENTKIIPSEEYYAIPVSLAQDRLKHIKCQLKYVPIYFLLCFCNVFFTSFSLAQLPRFLSCFRICLIFSFCSFCGVAVFNFSCAFAAFFLPCFLLCSVILYHCRLHVHM